MQATTYRIVPHPDGSFAIEVHRVGALPELAAGFPTEADAQSWIARDQRLSNASEPFRTAAQRKWSGV
jgi:hypothetical protein